MPYDIKHLRRDAVNIDIGNQLYWHDFNNLEMHDFFLKNLGVDFELIPDNWKCNHWLQDSFPKKQTIKINMCFSVRKQVLVCVLSGKIPLSNY
jgi:hypothetical protein